MLVSFNMSIGLAFGSGAGLNPALGLTITTFQCGYTDQDAKFIWVYIIFPFLGAAVATLVSKMHFS